MPWLCYMNVLLFFVFFKQKTAYEMRISDWSSDVCSSDLVTEANRRNHIAYKKALAGIPGVSVLEYDPAERNSHHYIVLEVDEQRSATRDQIIAALHAENVLARKYFWPGCHGMKPFKDLFPHAGLMLRGTMNVAGHVMVLPTGTPIGDDEIQSICSIIRLLACDPA